MAENSKKIVVLTGVTYGLGKAMADRLIEGGHTVLGCGRSEASIVSLRERYPTPHDFSVVDVSDDQAVAAWAIRLLEVYGPPDLILNNAALINETNSLWEVSAEEFSRLMRVNVDGVAHMIRRFVPAMIQRGEGVIVNFSSGWGRSVSSGVAPYCTSKWAIEGLSKALAEELPSGMACIPLNPGIIHTQMLESCYGAAAPSFPGPEEWSRHAVPYILQLGPKDSGQSLSVSI